MKNHTSLANFQHCSPCSCPIYVHIPYCLSKCDYCDFFSQQRRSIPDEYIIALSHEICAAKKERNIGSWSTVYIGGGTPSLLNEKQIFYLFDSLHTDARANTKEITFEVNPRDVTARLLETLSSCGVTRISCGFQSFSDEVLSGVHRLNTASDEAKALECIKKWRGVFSADMIAGLPGDKEEELIRGIKTLSDYGAAHISLYTLTIEENTPLGRRIAFGEAYDAENADNLYLAGRDELIRLGYEQYEVSNFCKDGMQCSHNAAYWQMSNYIGCGAGAVSSYYGKKIGKRYTNTNNINKYIGHWLSPSPALLDAPRYCETLDAKTMQFEYFMLGLRTAKGVSEERYKARFGESITKKTLSLFDEWQKKGLCHEYMNDGEHYRAMTSKGLLLLDRFLEEIM